MTGDSLKVLMVRVLLGLVVLLALLPLAAKARMIYQSAQSASDMTFRMEKLHSSQLGLQSRLETLERRIKAQEQGLVFFPQSQSGGAALFQGHVSKLINGVSGKLNSIRISEVTPELGQPYYTANVQWSGSETAFYEIIQNIYDSEYAVQLEQFIIQKDRRLNGEIAVSFEVSSLQSPSNKSSTP